MTLHKFLFCTLFALFFSGLVNTSYAADEAASTKTGVSQFFDNICTSVDGFERFAHYTGIPKRHLDKLGPMYEELWCSQYFKESFQAVVHRHIEKGGSPPDGQQLEALGMGLGQHLLDQGLALLDEKDLIKTFQLSMDVLSAMTTEECATYVKRRPLNTPNHRTLIDIVESAGDDVFKSYFGLRHQAIKKALENKRGWMPPSAQEVAYVSGVYYSALMALIKRRPDIGLAMDAEQKSDSAVCTRGKALTVTFLVLPPEVKTTAMRAFLTGRLGPPGK